MWGLIKTEVSKGWFVPSRGEWAAFGGELGINKTNYEDKGLSIGYWSSSQSNAHSAYGANFDDGSMYNGIVYLIGYVRLTTTF